MSVQKIEAPVRAAANRQSHKEQIFQKVMNWGERPSSSWTLFVLSFVQSAFIPAPLFLLFLTLSLGSIQKAFRFALICTVGSILGGVVAYALGFAAWETVKVIFIPHLFSENFLVKAETIYGKNIYLAALVTSFAPISFQVCALAAGVLKVNFWSFLAASCIARPIRFFFFALLVRRFGERTRRFIEGNLGWIMWMIVILLLLAGVLSLLHRILS
jgi:membrane protein YqaA with SNARE-associated domain